MIQLLLRLLNRENNAEQNQNYGWQQVIKIQMKRKMQHKAMKNNNFRKFLKNYNKYK